MFEQLESLGLESFVIRTPNGKREKSLAQHKARLDAKREKVSDKYRSKASKWIVNEHGTPVTVNGVRQSPFRPRRYFGLRFFSSIYAFYYSAYSLGAGTGPWLTAQGVELTGGYTTVLYGHAVLLVLASLLLTRLPPFPAWGLAATPGASAGHSAR